MTDVTPDVPLLRVDALSVRYRVRGGAGTGPRELSAVSELSFQVGRGETLGLVGESGCGKSTVAMAVCGLTAVSGGKVIFDGIDLGGLRSEERRRIRRRMQLVFQDPASSLNSRMTIEDLLSEPMVVHKLHRGPERQRRVGALLDSVGLPDVARLRYPHELSGGQRQRVALARALAADPQLIICDEPVTALDVSVRAQILNLLVDLQDRNHVSYLFISHDLGAVHHLADRVLVMYLGRPMELADRPTLFAAPAHPYTRALLEAMPTADPDQAKERHLGIRGEVPSGVEQPSGCVFHPRCPMAVQKCADEVPEWRNIGTSDRPQLVACHFAGPSADLAADGDLDQASAK